VLFNELGSATVIYHCMWLVSLQCTDKSLDRTITEEIEDWLETVDEFQGAIEDLRRR